MRPPASPKPRPGSAARRRLCPPAAARAVVPALLDWFAAHARDLPWRRTRDPYAIWVSEVMLQQTQVRTVIPYWERWMRRLPGVAALAGADADQLHKLWEGLGYYTRVRNLQRAARGIVRRHEGRFPTRFEEVLALPGVGRYTAGAICSIAFNQPTAIVDGNVARVLCRLRGIEGDPRESATRETLWVLAGALVRRAAKEPPRAGRARGRVGNCSAFNQALMELGAVVCTPRNPRCGACPLARWCVARRIGRQGELPLKPARPGITGRRMWAFIVERQGRFLVRQRPDGVVNARLWEFPNVEVGVGEGSVGQVARRELRFAPRGLRPMARVHHSITRYRITLEAFHGRAARGARTPPGGQWQTHSELASRAFPSAHARLLQALRQWRPSPGGSSGRR